MQSLATVHFSRSAHMGPKTPSQRKSSHFMKVPSSFSVAKAQASVPAALAIQLVQVTFSPPIHAHPTEPSLVSPVASQPPPHDYRLTAKKLRSQYGTHTYNGWQHPC